MCGLFVAYILLISFGLPAVELERLERADWLSGISALPVLFIAFGYHNLVPTLAHYLDKERKELRRSIIIGSFIPLLVYLVWEAVILGIVPFADKSQWTEAQGQGEMITQVLSRVAHSQMVVHFCRGFAFFAIATSFLPVAFSFLDFLRDGFHKKDTVKNRAIMGFAVLALPAVIALTKPHLFLTALSYAGGVSCMLLFGVLPVLMALRRGIGNRAAVSALAVISIGVVMMTILHEMGVL